MISTADANGDKRTHSARWRGGTRHLRGVWRWLWYNAVCTMFGTLFFQGSTIMGKGNNSQKNDKKTKKKPKEDKKKPAK
jgi:hypothetical protein